MNASSLQNKTIRPGSLGSYSYYHSARRPMPATYAAPKRVRHSSGLRRKVTATLVVLAALVVLPLFQPFGSGEADTPDPSGGKGANIAAAVGGTAPKKEAKVCAGNSRDKWVLVSVSQRKLWACEGSALVHDAPVITGILAYPETLTPPGTYKVYEKQLDVNLTGSDSAGSWDVQVDYWMPFLHNKHGVYGFHDAKWRPDSQFGKVSPYSKQASHGCVEMPMSDQAWLYAWAPVGTAVTVKN